ncbi:hypothetical protein K227x_54840 [Rubripirellula lacrimiformis]|uniref:Uncharacterized protein n=1 Tax=Rubripirellula lacrimiformis TaxID=1930273 RepID=A0A517NIU7_9BACT|nr:hypothetical protein [Rubripirellula lacrimiformis]QDT07059.1 hypothetical protein K227x_54840 [Rubripirellula lacrimiformis]
MLKLTYPVAFAALLTFGTAGCDVEQTREGALPDVDVDVDGTAGQLPAYDVDAPDVDASMEEKKVMVPKVVMEEESVSVPDVDVTLPKDE